MIDLYVDGVKVESLTGLEFNDVLLGLNYRQLRLNEKVREHEYDASLRDMSRDNFELIRRLGKVEESHNDALCRSQHESFVSGLTDAQKMAMLVLLSGQPYCSTHDED